MILVLNYLIFIIEAICLVRLVRLLGVRNLYTLFYIAVFYYAQAVFLDYLILGHDRILSTNRNIIVSVYNADYLYANSCYYLFLQTYYFCALRFKKYTRSGRADYSGSKMSVFYSFFLLLFSAYNLYSFISHFGLVRSELGAGQTPLILVLYNTAIYTGIFVATGLKKHNIATVIYLCILVVMLLFSYEREPVLIAGLVFLFRFSKRFNDKVIILFIPVGILVLAFYKLFFSTVLYSSGTGWAGFESGVNDTQFSFAGIDPLSSFALLCDYFNHNIYDQYFLSYLTNFYGQTYRMFFGGTYKSIAEYSSLYYTNGNYGIAFCMILESLLNFSFLGPIILAIAITNLYKTIYKKSRKYFIPLLVIICFISVKLIRTELMTIIKIQIVPALISYYLFDLFNRKSSKVNATTSHNMHSDI